jgi:peroxiredoxin
VSRPDEDGNACIAEYTVDGLTLVGDLGGPEDGPTVILLHGGGQTRHSWSGTWRVLVDAGWRALSVDMRGHGQSDWADDGDYSMDAFSSDVVALATAMPSPPVLVGASLGGLSSLCAITESPTQTDVARALVLVDVAHQMEEQGRLKIGQFMMERMEEGFGSLEEAADAVAAYNPHRPRPKDLSGLARNLRQRDGRWYWHWDPAFITGKLGAADETRSSVVDPNRLTDAVDVLEIPTLLVRGRQSDLLSEQGAQDFLARVPHAQYADVSGAGHMVAGDRNEVFNAAILDFLDHHRR